MGRLIVLVLVLIGSAIIFVIKFAASKVTGNDEVSFQDETKKVMNKTAKGVNWMNEQWEEAKNNAKENDKKLNS